MYLYVKAGEAVKRVSGIHLERCFVPTVGSYLQHSVEPALWFKVLVLDSVFVNCDLGYKRVYWSSDRENARAARLHDVTSERLTVAMVIDFFRTQEAILEDELDPTFGELFDVAYDIFTCLHGNHDGEDPNQNANEAAYKHTVRLLHVYILPNIKLGPNQKSKVLECLETVSIEACDIETLIAQHANTKQTNRKILKAQRQDLLNSGLLTKTPQLMKLDVVFLETFLYHVVEDVENERKTVQRFEDQINPLRNSKSPENRDRLEQLRLDRNAAHKNFEKYLGTREEIQNFLCRKSQGRIKVNDSDETMTFPEYTKRTELLSQLDNDIRQLMKRKLKVLTVKTAAEQTLKDIEEHGDSLGFSCMAGTRGFRAEIVPSTEGVPQVWETLQDKMATLLNNNRLHYGTAWRMFWLTKKQKLETKLDQLEEEEKNGKESIVEVAECEMICQNIKNHLDDMSMKMATELCLGSGNFVHQELISKVFLCYEQHVTVHLMQSVSKWFSRAYNEQCSRLSKWLSERSDVIDFQNPEVTLKLAKRLPKCCDIIDNLKTSKTIADSLRQVTLLVKVLEGAIQGTESSIMEEGPCCDDLVDIVVQMLHKMNKDALLCLYSKTKLLDILCPDFLRGSAHNYSLVTVSVAFQHLMNQAALDTAESDC